MCTLLVVIAPLTVPQCEARRYNSLRHEERHDLEADIDVQQQVVRELSVSQQSGSNGDLLLPNAHFEAQEGPGQVHSTGTVADQNNNNQKLQLDGFVVEER